MSFSMGIVGLPNVGKSTLFNALTKKSVPAENYPFCTIDPSVGIVAVPDERLTALSSFSNSKKTVPAAAQFVDIAGLVEGAAKGEGLGNKFLSHIRETDAILQVVRIFEDDKVIHVSGNIDPVRDISVINLELVLADFETVTKRLASIGKDANRGDKDAVREEKALKKAVALLEAGHLASSGDYSSEELSVLKNVHLISMKPILYALNKKAGGKNLDEIRDGRFEKLIEFIKSMGAGYVVVDAKIEDELKEFEGSEKESLRGELGGGDDGVNSLIRESYSTLGLITFFTTGEDETRGWTIVKGSTAPLAGAAIRTDFKNKFIRAEVVFWKDLLDAGSYGEARNKGLVRTEGKEYVVKDGDVIEFKI